MAFQLQHDYDLILILVINMTKIGNW